MKAGFVALLVIYSEWTFASRVMNFLVSDDDVTAISAYDIFAKVGITKLSFLRDLFTGYYA